MQEHGELVLEAEHKTSQRVVVAALLCHTVFTTEQHALSHFANLHLLVGGTLKDVVSVTGEIGTVASMTYDILLQDASWDNPLRIDLHPLYLTAQQRCLRLRRATDYAHVQQTVVAIGIEVVGGDIDNDILTSFRNRIVQAPAGAFHIAEDALPLFSCRGIFQHAFQLVVELVLRLNARQILGNAVVSNLTHHRQMVVGRGLLHIYVEESTVTDYLRRLTILLLLRVKVVENTRGIHETIAIAIGIAQTSLCEVALQTCCHMIDVGSTLAKLQLTQQLQVVLDSTDIESLLRESYFTDLMQVCQQRVSTVVDACSVNP